jgi:hypothetical protein
MSLASWAMLQFFSLSKGEGEREGREEKGRLK